jgi:L-fuculose-phosphate aldolase
MTEEARVSVDPIDSVSSEQRPSLSITICHDLLRKHSNAGNSGSIEVSNVKSDTKKPGSLGRKTAAGGLGKAAAVPKPNPRLFTTAKAEAIKKEICAVGKKLWLRQFVDGNGGNISYRIGPNEILCTPTLVSKYDLTPEDLCLVDLEANQIAGSKGRTSEIRLHLEIYKEVPEAKAVVHCHPPHATAYAITGRVPPNLVIPEFEVFVGKVAISPYETPGTTKFAQTVLPFVRDHNTLLLANHGIVCWADTVTHAEWYAEVLETYCWTLTIAAQLGAPISRITEEKGAELLALKKSLGLPDVRFDPARVKALRRLRADEAAARECKVTLSEADQEALVKAVTEAVLKVVCK